MTAPTSPLASSRSLSIGIARPLALVYDFLAEPGNFPRWASGLCSAIEVVDGAWIATTPTGRVRVGFTERNRFGVLDHWVFPASGAAVYVPMRVIANGDGCELVLTLFRPAAMTAENFAADLAWVERDLAALKTLLEA